MLSLYFWVQISCLIVTFSFMKIAGSGFRLVNIDMTHWAYEYTLPVTFVSVTSLQRTDFWEGKCRGRIEEKNGHQSCTSLVMLYHMTKYQQNYGLIEFHDHTLFLCLNGICMCLPWIIMPTSEKLVCGPMYAILIFTGNLKLSPFWKQQLKLIEC